MHYYKRNIGDYAKKAGRLSMLQHGAYTLLIDACYDREQFPTLEEAIEWTWASTTEEEEAVRFVLRKFFVLEDGVYVQNRIREEFEAYRSKSAINTRIAIKRESKRREENTKRAQDVHEAPPNQEPLTINQEPVTTNTLVPTKVETQDCPHDAIIALYHKHLPTGTQVRLWNEQRQAKLRARWREDKVRQTLDWWDGFFGWIAESPFLTGKVSSMGSEPFQIDLEWIVSPRNFAKIYEGKYHSKRMEAA